MLEARHPGCGTSAINQHEADTSDIMEGKMAVEGTVSLADDPSSIVVSAVTTDNDRQTPEDNIHCMRTYVVDCSCVGVFCCCVLLLFCSVVTHSPDFAFH